MTAAAKCSWDDDRGGRVLRWECWELELRSHGSYANPFRDVRVIATFTAPDGRCLTVDGFHDGGGRWRVRFAPDAVGRWTYRVASEPADAGLMAEGALRCVGAVSHGFAGQHPHNLYAFAYTDGVPFFHLGDTCYALTALPRAARLAYLERRRAQGFSHVRFQIGGGRFIGSQTAWMFGGTPRDPDLDRYNPAYFQRVDGLLADLRAAGLGAEIILLDYYGRRNVATSANGAGATAPAAGGYGRTPMLTPAWTPEREAAGAAGRLGRRQADGA